MVRDDDSDEVIEFISTLADVTDEHAKRMLDSPRAVALLSKSRRKKMRKVIARRLRESTAYLREQMAQYEARLSLYAIVPSPWWADFICAELRRQGCFAYTLGSNRSAAARRGVYPIPGQVQCRECHRYVSPQYVTARAMCEDCVVAALVEAGHELPTSPIVVDMRVAIRQAQLGRVDVAQHAVPATVTE